mmetsp:Transcript_11583/g.28405  ORF Transcript_11583/g.28405 Transcript_11583/m.28405 type:complete len:100 (+) Transcript_11583:223-522(+)
MKFSEIKASKCPGLVFGNSYGVLACEDMPSGDYIRSCRSCYKHDGVLTCNCNGSPPAKTTSIRVDRCHRFANVGGELACADGYEAELLDAGKHTGSAEL